MNNRLDSRNCSEMYVTKLVLILYVRTYNKRKIVTRLFGLYSLNVVALARRAASRFGVGDHVVGAVTSRKRRQFHAARKTVRYVCVEACVPVSISFCSNLFRLEWVFTLMHERYNIAYAKVVECRKNSRLSYWHFDNFEYAVAIMKRTWILRRAFSCDCSFLSLPWFRLIESVTILYTSVFRFV